MQLTPLSAHWAPRKKKMGTIFSDTVYYLLIFLLILISCSYVPICTCICSLVYVLAYKRPAIPFAVYLFVFSTNKFRPMFSWTPQWYRVTYLLLYLWAQYSSENVLANGGIHPRIPKISTKGDCSVLPYSQRYLQRRNTHKRVSWPQSHSGHCREDKYLFPWCKSKPNFPILIQ